MHGSCKMSKEFLCHVCEEPSEDFQSALDHFIASHPTKPINLRRLYLDPSTGDLARTLVHFRVTPIEVWRQGRTLTIGKEHSRTTKLVIKVSSADHETNENAKGKRNSKFKSYVLLVNLHGNFHVFLMVNACMGIFWNTTQ